MNKKQKQLTQIFTGLFIMASLAIYWNEVSWIFSYRVAYGLAYDFFNPYQDSSLLVSANYAVFDDAVLVKEPVQNTQIQPVAPSTAVAAAKQPAKKTYAAPDSQKTYALEIPAIGLVTPIVISQSTEVKALIKDLDKGVVFYPGSANPWENGHTVLLGHSAPPNWPKIKHDWVFSDLNNLKEGDQILLYFNGKKYTYSVIGKEIIAAGEDINVSSLSADTNILSLVSCWPPGKNYKRIAVQAKLTSN